jgi:hypothetical protein
MRIFFFRILVGRSEKKDHLGDLVADGGIILKSIKKA